MSSPAAGRAWVLPWLMFGLAASLYTYAFVQRVAPNVMVDELMRDLGLGAALLGNLSAFYFYSYAGLQVPLGIVLDRFGARAILTLAALGCAAGSALFATADTPLGASLGQLLIGAGAGVPFVGALVIARAWLPPERFAFVTGMIMFSGMAGAFLGQVPLAALVDVVHWRSVYHALGAAAFLWAVLLWFTVRDRPPQVAGAPPATEGAAPRAFWRDLGTVAANRQTWLISLYGALIAGPVLSFLSLWSVAYLMQAYAMDRPGAAATTSIMMLGWAIGAPASGWAADRLRVRKAPMVTGAAVGLVVWLALALAPGTPLPLLQALLFVLGLAAGTMGVMFAYLREHNQPRLGSTATGLFNTVCMLSPAAFQPFVGWLLELGWDGTMADGAPVYDADAFRAAFLVYPACFGLRETAGRQVVLDR